MFLFRLRFKSIAALSLLMLLIPIGSFSQNLDSISNQLQGHDIDTSILRQSIIPLQDQSFVRTEKSDSLVRIILSISKAKEYQNGVAQVYRYFGIAYFDKGDYKSSTSNHRNALKLFRELNDSTCITASNLSLASSYFNMGRPDSAIFFCNKAINSFKFRNNHKKLATSYNTLGGIYWSKGDFPKAAEALYKSLEMKQQLGDSIGMANAYNNIGILFDSQQKLNEALDMYYKSLEIYQKKESKKGISKAINNIAIVLKNLNRCGEAIEMLLRSLEIDKELGNLNEQGKTLNNIGQLYLQIKEPQKAIIYFENALKIFTLNKDNNGETATTINLGKAYSDLGNYTKANNLLKKGLISAQRDKSLEWIKESYMNLYQLNKRTGNSNAALSYFERYSTFNDSLRSVENLNRLDELKLQFETVQKEKEIVILSKENDLSNLEIKRQKSISWFLFSLAGLFILIAFLVGYGWLIIRKDNRNLLLKNFEINQQKEEIEAQRDMLESYNSKLNCQNEEILAQRDQIENKNTIITASSLRLTDNIEYASRIQKALLPDLNLINGYFSNQFIVYKPKDIVSGDFYWMWPLEDKICFAVADCTGHGVSGAFMSILAYNLLKDSIITKKLSNPQDIVAFICNEVENNLYSNLPIHEVKDGMDIIVCCYYPKQQLLEFSGAHSSFLHFRDSILTNYKTDRYSIGSRVKQKSPFTNQQLLLQKGDRIIFYTDGYMDQLDDVNRRKMGRTNFFELIQRSSNLGLSSQEETIINYLNSWKRNSEQIDDILIWGIEV